MLHVLRRTAFPGARARWASKNAQRQRERDRAAQLRKNHAREQHKKLVRWSNLAEPAKRKRVLSLCDFWLGDQNLCVDDFIQRAMSRHDGWFPVAALLTFPKMRTWCKEATAIGALSGPGAERYELDERGGHALFRRVAFGRRYEEAKAALRADGCDEARDINSFELAAVLRAAGCRRDDDDDDDENALMTLTETSTTGRFVRDESGLAWALPPDDDAVDEPAAPRARAPKEFRYFGRVIVARNARDIAALVRAVRDALDASGGGAVGLDVEYATLECDLRPRPAVVSLAASGVVGLVWLHHLPGFGRGLLSAPWGAPVRELLADRAVAKVGVGTDQDARSLLEWCAEDAEGAAPTVAGVVDLARAGRREVAAGLARVLSDTCGDEGGEDDDERAGGHELKLSALCESLLRRRLIKRKFRGARGSRASKKAHWRAPELTPQMTRYAAEDAAAALAVWSEFERRLRKRALHADSSCPMERLALTLEPRDFTSGGSSESGEVDEWAAFAAQIDRELEQ